MLLIRGSEAHATTYIWRSLLLPFVDSRDQAQFARIVWQAPLSIIHKAISPAPFTSFIHITLTKSSPCKTYCAQHQKCQGQDAQESEEKATMVELQSDLPRSRWKSLTDSNQGTRVGGEPGEGMPLRNHERGQQRGGEDLPTEENNAA